MTAPEPLTALSTIAASSAESVADALVLTFTAGVGLCDWDRTGVLQREWSLYAKLGPRFGRIVLVTWGGEDDRQLARKLPFEGTQQAIVLPFTPETSSGDGTDVATQVAEALDGCASAIVKTNQMNGGHIAIAITEALRKRTIRTALIARGGYHWSRFAAREHGADSPEACTAAAREGQLCRASDLVICTTQEMADDLAWRYELPRERFEVVPNYVAFSPARRPEKRTDQTILFAGRLETQKRIDRLIEAVALLPRDLRDRAHLLIIGDGSQRQGLKALAKDRNVRASFRPRMPHEQLLTHMADCDVYAQVSDYEGHPKTVLEAMAAGAPVLVCDTPGLGNTVEDGTTGVRTRPEPEAIAAGLVRLLSDRKLAGTLGTRAASHVRTHYALDVTVQRELAACQRALQNARADSVMSTAQPPVHFRPELLTADVPAAVSAWIQPLRGFARRLDAQKRAKFLMALDTPFYHLQGESAVEADGGLHPKHRLMRYHDFFVDRIGKGERIIDLGSGVGALAASIAERAGATVLGIELAAQTIAKARARVQERGLERRVEFIQGDITELRAPGTFDAIVLSNVLEHITDRPQRLRRWREWYGHESSSIRFLIRVPAFDRDWRAPWKKELGVEWRLDPTHETEYTRTQLEQECREAGLSIRECIVQWGEYYIVAAPA